MIRNFLVLSPWEIFDTQAQRAQRSYLMSYHGPGWDESKGLDQLLSLRSVWREKREAHGHPRNWPENAGRWTPSTADAVVTYHLAVEWETEWKRIYRPMWEGGWCFVQRTKPLPRAIDPHYPHEDARKRDGLPPGAA